MPSRFAPAGNPAAGGPRRDARLWCRLRWPTARRRWMATARPLRSRPCRCGGRLGQAWCWVVVSQLGRWLHLLCVLRPCSLSPGIWWPWAAKVGSTSSCLLNCTSLPRPRPPQGHIWAGGFARGELKGELFADVPDALAQWRGAGIKTYIYSSGSRWVGDLWEAELHPLSQPVLLGWALHATALVRVAPLRPACPAALSRLPLPQGRAERSAGLHHGGRPAALPAGLLRHHLRPQGGCVDKQDALQARVLQHRRMLGRMQSMPAVFE